MRPYSECSTSMSENRIVAWIAARTTVVFYPFPIVGFVSSGRCANAGHYMGDRHCAERLCAVHGFEAPSALGDHDFRRAFGDWYRASSNVVAGSTWLTMDPGCHAAEQDDREIVGETGLGWIPDPQNVGYVGYLLHDFLTIELVCDAYYIQNVGKWAGAGYVPASQSFRHLLCSWHNALPRAPYTAPELGYHPGHGCGRRFDRPRGYSAHQGRTRPAVDPDGDRRS